MGKKIKQQKWFPMAVALCIAILFFFLLIHLGDLWDALGSIFYFLYPVIAGVIIAYLRNPLMKVLENHAFRFIKKKGLKRTISLVLSMIIGIAAITAIIMLLVPQLYDSVMMLYANREEYLSGLTEWLDSTGLSKLIDKFGGGFTFTPEAVMGYLMDFLAGNVDNIKSALSNVGGHLWAWILGLIFSVYFLASKESIAESCKNILRGMIKNEEKYNEALTHIKKIDNILIKYILFSLFDGVLIGTITAIFMLITGMDYIGLIAIIIGVTDLIPTFGPIIGTIIAALILLLVNPTHAIIFVIFYLVLQQIDGYVIRPKLYGNTFGVSGLWILVAIIVGGRMFGVLGILLGVPVIAILDYLFKQVIIPKVRARREKAIRKANGLDEVEEAIEEAVEGESKPEETKADDKKDDEPEGKKDDKSEGK